MSVLWYVIERMKESDKENGSIFVYTPKRPTVIYKSWPMTVHLVIIIVFLLFFNILTEFLHRLYGIF